MTEEFLKSWKGALTVTALLLITITSYKLLFGNDATARLDEHRFAIAFPSGQPNAEIMQRQVAAATPYVSLEFTLRQFTNFLKSKNLVLAWEPLDSRRFILRASGVHALNDEHTELGLQFVLLDGPDMDGELIGSFTGKAVGIESMSIDRELVDEMTIALALADIVHAVRRQPR